MPCCHSCLYSLGCLRHTYACTLPSLHSGDPSHTTTLFERTVHSLFIATSVVFSFALTKHNLCHYTLHMYIYRFLCFTTCYCAKLWIIHWRQAANKRQVCSWKVTHSIAWPNLCELVLFHPYFVCKCSFREISMIKMVILDQSKPYLKINNKLHLYYSKNRNKTSIHPF